MGDYCGAIWEEQHNAEIILAQQENSFVYMILKNKK